MIVELSRAYLLSCVSGGFTLRMLVCWFQFHLLLKQFAICFAMSCCCLAFLCHCDSQIPRTLGSIATSKKRHGTTINLSDYRTDGCEQQSLSNSVKKHRSYHQSYTIIYYCNLLHSLLTSHTPVLPRGQKRQSLCEPRAVCKQLVPGSNDVLNLV